MLDREGFRPNVGIILLNQQNQVFWGKRIRTHSWQFPQGGIKYGETPEQAMFRELHEEVGLQPGARAHRRAHPRLAALRGARPLHPPRRARPLQGPEADLVPAAADRPRQRPEPARHRPSRVRRLALERLLGAARRGGRVQARRLPDGADRAGALPAAPATTTTATCAAACVRATTSARRRAGRACPADSSCRPAPPSSPIRKSA